MLANGDIDTTWTCGEHVTPKPDACPACDADRDYARVRGWEGIDQEGNLVDLEVLLDERAARRAAIVETLLGVLGSSGGTLTFADVPDTDRVLILAVEIVRKDQPPASGRMILGARVIDITALAEALAGPFPPTIRYGTGYRGIPWPWLERLQIALDRPGSIGGVWADRLIMPE